jgi:hypothetical protein
MIEKPVDCRSRVWALHRVFPLRCLSVWLVLIVLVSALSLGPGVARPASAQTRISASVTSQSVVRFSSLGWSSQTVSGTNPNLDLYIPGPGNVSLGDKSTLTIIYSRSGLLDTQHSFVAVYINSVNVGGYMLTGGFHRTSTFSFPIPANLLISNGFNHLQLNFSLRNRLTTTPVCGTVDPALSATIYGTSRLRYDARPVAVSGFNPDLALMPAPFALAGASAPPSMLVALPTSPSATELTAAGDILGRFGEDAPSAPPAVRSVPASTLSGYGGRSAHGAHVLLVGTPRDNPAVGRIGGSSPVPLRAGLWRDAGGRPLPPNEGVVLELRSPWDSSRAVLVASGNGQEGVRRAGLTLASATLRSFLSGKYATLTTAPDVPQTPATSNVSTLASLGYKPVTLQGNGDLSWRLSFDLQGSPTRAGGFTLVFGHGLLPADGAPAVRLDLNGQPIASRSLKSDDGQRQQWSVPLPIDALRPGTNMLDIHFFLAGSQSSCQRVTSPGLWATIETASTLTMPGTDGIAVPDLGKLPSPLLVNANPNRSIIVLPDSSVNDSGALNLAVFMGTQAKVDTPLFEVLTASQATQSKLQGHTVLMDGLPNSNRLVRQIQSRLPLRSSANGQMLGGPTGAIHAAAQMHGTFGLVEEFLSPWDSSQIAVLISGSDARTLPAARLALAGGNLSGTVALVDRSGNARSIDTGSLDQAQAPKTTRSNRPIQAIALGGVLLAAIQVLLALARGVSKKGNRK